MFRSFVLRLLGAGLAIGGLLLLTPQVAPAQEKDVPPDEGVTVLGRGPIHEAFAEPADKNPAATPVVPKKPSDPVPEEPPDQKPQGDNVEWIPGYWAWDQDKSDFIWISGVWRVPPQGRKWAPGHWTQVTEGWQWVPGFWMDEKQENTQYLPEPPASLDNGPQSTAPDENSFYVPGTWLYQDSSYAWRPGYWFPAHEGWVWNASCYRWTPAGYVYVNGYWDYPLANRGIVFAPVYFDRPLWQTSGWFYRPRFALDLATEGIFASLFVRPGYGHYYFGDYYDARYLNAGFWPWYSYGYHRYDPFFAYHSWTNRSDPNWVTGLRSSYMDRRNGVQPRPPQTYSASRAGAPAGRSAQPQLIAPLSQLAARQPMTKLSPAQITEHRATAQRFQEASSQRVQKESAAAAAPRPAPKAPVVAPPGRTTPPPKAQEAAPIPSEQHLQIEKPPATAPRPTITPKAEPQPRSLPPAQHQPPPPQVAPPHVGGSRPPSNPGGKKGN
jgi:hypothetical protein